MCAFEPIYILNRIPNGTRVYTPPRSALFSTHPVRTRNTAAVSKYTVAATGVIKACHSLTNYTAGGPDNKFVKFHFFPRKTSNVLIKDMAKQLLCWKKHRCLRLANSH